MAPRSQLARLTAAASIAAALVTATGGAAIAEATPQRSPAGPPPASTSAHGFGLIPDSTPVPAARMPRIAVGALPPSVDLTKWSVPVGDQGPIGSCATWAIDYAMLGWYSNRHGKAGQPFAPMYTYSQISKASGGDNGSTFKEVFELARTSGSETMARYPQGDFDYFTQPTSEQRIDAANHRISSWQKLFSGSYQGDAGVRAIKRALAQGKPVALGIPVRDGFYELSSNPSAVVDDTTSEIYGYHAVLALGYNASGVLIQNSWGTGWGNQGFGRLSWDVVREDVFGAYTIDGFATPTVQQTGERAQRIKQGVTRRLRFGKPGDVPLSGDWNGDRVDTPGAFSDGTFRLRSRNTSGPATRTFAFGRPGDVPVVGDWDGNGTDTIGVVRGNTWYLRNSNSAGPADVVFTFGLPGDIPVVGDWNGDRVDTVGMIHGTTWELRNANADGGPDRTFDFGQPGDARLAGDWNGDGIDTPGVVRGSTWYLRNVNGGGPPHVRTNLGRPGDVPLAGRFSNDSRRDTPSAAR
jgi:hypothetical protein